MALCLEMLEPRNAPAVFLPELALALPLDDELTAVWDADLLATAEVSAAEPLADAAPSSPLDRLADDLAESDADLFRHDPEILAALAEWHL